jgi:hypothetical protein
MFAGSAANMRSDEQKKLVRGAVLQRAALTSVEDFMSCLLLLFTRIVLLMMWFFTNYLNRAFHGLFMIPLIGFIIFPLTTIVFAWELNNHVRLDGNHLFEGNHLLWLFLAAAIDLAGSVVGWYKRVTRN